MFSRTIFLLGFLEFSVIAFLLLSTDVGLVKNLGNKTLFSSSTIVRILMTKLRASTTSETIQYRKAVKATLVLLPLLGITYMLFFVNPGEDDISQIVFVYFNSFLQSFQGFFVSVFYCFLNGEVRSAVRKRWHRWQDNHDLRVRVARAMSIPTSPTRISFHSIKQTTLFSFTLYFFSSEQEGHNVVVVVVVMLLNWTDINF
ncbi:hypothetical protein F7725_011338 [Dissostichus mawsoni]|uniref:G-protein coupled receptors family 2 profile 2 domain-containing protein n=1 Tax=Dissostichus mawsoni TaxID=36200 RepID=A0A7J5ZBT3_DISMA|nr:hypothetical protein F7725_011338 [Dissostichus mawsoni]